jgi:hypothetical protein
VKKHLLWPAAFLCAGLMATALSLFHHENTFCTTSERGWPFGVVIHPCLCYGQYLGHLEWFISPAGLALNTIFYAVLAGIVFGLVRTAGRFVAASKGQAISE